MSDFLTLPEIDEVANSIRSRTNYRPRIAMVLGSGLGGLASSVENAAVIPYNELPGWPVSTVVGHQGYRRHPKCDDQEANHRISCL